MKYLSFLTLIFIYACSSSAPQEKQDPSGFNFKEYFSNIEKADNCINKGEGFQVLGQRMNIPIKDPLEKIESVETLKNLYYKAIDKQASTAPPESGRCMDINIAVKGHTLQRLAKLNNEESINVLIHIYSDKNISFNRNEAKSFARLLIGIGPSILPRIEPIKDQRPVIGPMVIQGLKSS